MGYKRNIFISKMKIETYDGKEQKEIDCIGCAIESGNTNPMKGTIIKTKFFDVHQDFEVPIPGFIIVTSRRHFLSISDFTEEEQIEFITLISKIRNGMKDVLNIEEAYLFQNEDSRHHFHLWMFPRYDWMEKFGRKIESVRPILKYAKENLKTKENLILVEEAVLKMKKYM